LFGEDTSRVDLHSVSYPTLQPSGILLPFIKIIYEVSVSMWYTSELVKKSYIPVPLARHHRTKSSIINATSTSAKKDMA
jgi:hypothetical protein